MHYKVISHMIFQVCSVIFVDPRLDLGGGGEGHSRTFCKGNY